MTPHPSRRPSLRTLLPLALLAALAACGGGDDGGDVDPDSRVDSPDARVESPDGRVPADAGEPDAQGEPDADVSDDIPFDIIVRPGAFSLLEGTSRLVFVELSADPGVDVTVQIASSSTLAVSPSTLTFRAGTGTTMQRVEVTAPVDRDTTIGAGWLRFSAPRTDTVEVQAAITEVQTLPVPVLSPAAVTLREDARDRVVVQLDRAPTGPTTVLVTCSPLVALMTPIELTFTADNWNRPQELTVIGIHDTNTVDERATITAIADGGRAQTALTVTDVDTVGISLTPPSMTIAEGATLVAQVKLTAQPTAATVVDIVADGAAVSVSPSSLTVTPANWNVSRVVTIGAHEDADSTDETAAIRFSIAGAERASLPISVRDNDPIGAPQVVLSQTAVSLAEGVATPVTVALARRPASDVVVGLRSTDTSVVVVTPPRLTFTPGNFDQPQEVSLVAVVDDDATADRARIEVLTIAGTVGTIDVTVPDDAVRAIIASASSLTVAENGTVDVDVRLSAPPTQGVVVRVVSSDLARVQSQPAGLVFSRLNWNVAQRVTLRGVTDTDTGDQVVNVSLEGDGFHATTIAVTVDDVDTRAIVASPLRLRIPEGGELWTFVRLNRPPGGTVTVQVVAPSPHIATATPSQLVFNDSNWATTQTVTIRGTRDTNDVNDSTQLSLTLDRAATEHVDVEILDNRP